MPELVSFRRGEEVLRLGLGRQRTVLGSAEPSDVVLPDPQVSPQHVALRCEGTRCLLEDLSGKGTLVAGSLLTDGELLDGADLTLGQWRAVFRVTDVQPPQAQEPRGTPAQLRVKQGDTEVVHEIGAESFTLGTDPANTVVIQDRFISPKHLQVTRRGTGFHVRDLSSTHGTFRGSIRLFEAEILLNTLLRVGETELLFEPALQGQQVPSFHGLVGHEPAMRHLVELLKRVAPSNAGVLILGESGTGKELVARALHAASPRADKPLLSINCGALPPNIIATCGPGWGRGCSGRIYTTG
jgi:pSer/pThr/pTyr-binding forkhead associated (FHA) protein